MAGQDVEVRIGMEDGGAVSNGDGGDEAVDERPRGLSLPSTRSVQRGGSLEVHRHRGDEGGRGEQAAEVGQVLLVASTGEDFHEDGLADGEVSAEELVDSGADRAPGVAQELDPRR